MEYRGYTGVADYDPRDEIFYGHVAGIDGLITFEAVTAQRLYWEFRKAVDDYIDSLRSCEEEPEPPRKPAAPFPAAEARVAANSASATGSDESTAPIHPDVGVEPEPVLQQAAA